MAVSIAADDSLLIGGLFRKPLTMCLYLCLGNQKCLWFRMPGGKLHLYGGKLNGGKRRKIVGSASISCGTLRGTLAEKSSMFDKLD